MLLTYHTYIFCSSSSCSLLNYLHFWVTAQNKLFIVIYSGHEFLCIKTLISLKRLQGARQIIIYERELLLLDRKMCFKIFQLKYNVSNTTMLLLSVKVPCNNYFWEWNYAGHRGHTYCEYRFAALKYLTFKHKPDGSRHQYCSFIKITIRTLIDFVILAAVGTSLRSIVQKCLGLHAHHCTSGNSKIHLWVLVRTQCMLVQRQVVITLAVF